MPVAVPVQSGRVGGGFGPRPCHSARGQECVHAGWDFVAAAGDPVFAADDGIVERIFRTDDPRSRMRGYGNVVVLKHDDGTWTSYNHLSRIDVAPDQYVRGGEQVGAAGTTTNGRYFIAPHLHFEVRHAKPNGLSPFPGAYGRFNIDPADWFARRGLTPSGIPGTLADYVPDNLREARSLWESWGRAITGLVVFNATYRVATGEWLVFRPFETKRERHVRAAMMRKQERRMPGSISR